MFFRKHHISLEGLCTSKTVNGAEHRYWYQDGQLVYEERGDSKQFYYSYDGVGHLSCIGYYHIIDQ